MSDYESLQSSYNNLNAQYNSYKSSHSHTNDEYNSYGQSQYNAGKSSVTDGVPQSISFSYGGSNWQRYQYSPPLVTVGHTQARVVVSLYGYGQAMLLGLKKNSTSWTTIKNGSFSGVIDVSDYVAIALECGGYEPGYDASGSGSMTLI